VGRDWGGIGADYFLNCAPLKHLILKEKRGLGADGAEYFPLLLYMRDEKRGECARPRPCTEHLLANNIYEILRPIRPTHLFPLQDQGFKWGGFWGGIWILGRNIAPHSRSGADGAEYFAQLLSVLLVWGGWGGIFRTTSERSNFKKTERGPGSGCPPDPLHRPVGRIFRA
jgi:hypothetical protein